MHSQPDLHSLFFPARDPESSPGRHYCRRPDPLAAFARLELQPDTGISICGLASPFSDIKPSVVVDRLAPVHSTFSSRASSLDSSPVSSVSSDLDLLTGSPQKLTSIQAFVATRSRVVRVCLSLITINARRFMLLSPALQPGATLWSLYRRRLFCFRGAFVSSYTASFTTRLIRCRSYLYRPPCGRRLTTTRPMTMYGPCSTPTTRYGTRHK
jgi:hypothetical protein